MAAHLFRIVAPVGDIERAAAFYERVLDARGARISPGRHYIECGGVILALFDPSRDGDAKRPAPLAEHLYFAVDDLEAALERARAAGGDFSGVEEGAGPRGEIALRPWGERSFYMRDPFGAPLCFVDRRTTFTGEKA